MALDPEFLHHLHELMVEVAEELAEPEQEYKAQLLWTARQTRNAAATPIAYKDAALHAFKTRVEKTIEKYIEALSIWGIVIDGAVEKEFTEQIVMLTAGPKHLSFPPALTGTQIQAVQSEFARERERLAFRLIRQGTNRLRELKIKAKQINHPASATVNIFNGRTSINSLDQSINNIEISLPDLTDIDCISEGSAELQAAAHEIRSAPPQSATLLDKLQKWASLLNSVDGLAEKVHEHYPHIATLISKLNHLVK
jgi:hypothetical protein